jgi:hypothetical protein
MIPPTARYFVCTRTLQAGGNMGLYQIPMSEHVWLRRSNPGAWTSTANRVTLEWVMTRHLPPGKLTAS